MNALRRSGVYGFRSVGWALLICVVYAISGEVHQLFVPGRGGQVTDVVIDTVGASVGIGLYLVVDQLMISKEKLVNSSRSDYIDTRVS